MQEGPLIPIGNFAMTSGMLPGLRFDNWVDILECLADERPDKKAFGYLLDGEGAELQLLYAELARSARSIGAALREQGVQGQRVLLLYPPGLEFISAFLGCLYGGAIAVPAYPPDPMRLARSLPRLQAIAADAQTDWVLTTGLIHGMAGALFDIAPDFGKMHWLATDTLADMSAAWRRPEVGPDRLALLQYTSGSTGTPKGVMLSHGHLLHNSKCIQAGFAHSEQSSGVTWLPLYHDMGLIGGVLQPLFAGGPCTLLSPLDFLRRPLRWLQAITRFRATTSGGPNFAYDLCLRKISASERATLDLSSWRMAPVGAEPVSRETLERFAATFAECGFRREALFPCYGLAEATLFVSGGHLGSSASPLSVQVGPLEHGRIVPGPGSCEPCRELLSCGLVVPEMQVVIADPEQGTRCAAAQIGEIWVSGPSVALGYWNRPQETEEIFSAQLSDDGVRRGRFLRTGDLGFLHGGQLFVTGRRKDVIILHGRNLYPQDIERTLENSHQAVRPGCTAAFALQWAGEERLAVAVELQRKRGESAAAGEDLPSLAAGLAEAVAVEHEVVPQIVLLLPPGALPKTSSGKIQRQACRAAYQAGELELLSQWSAAERMAGMASRPRTPTEELVAGAFGDLLSLEQVGRLDNFFELGGQSLLGTQLLGRLRALCGVEVPLRSLFLSPTVAGLARYIDQAQQRGESLRQPALTAAARPPELPLSFGQQRLWFLAQLNPSCALYNVAATLRLEGLLDVARLEGAIGEIVARHEALRTVFRVLSGTPHQVVLPAAGWQLPIIDVTDDSAPACIEQEARAAFDLVSGPLLRTRLFRRSPRAYTLLIAMHHIIADGLSLGLLVRELAALYAASAGGAAPLLPELPVQYADYAAWQRSWLSDEVLSSQLAYWRKQLALAPPFLDLPTNRPRPAQRSDRGGTQTRELPSDLHAQLQALGRREGVTLFMTLLSAFQVVLQRYAGQDDIVVGSPIGGRTRPETERLIGFFANTLVLRTQLTGDPTIRALLARVREVTLDAYAHQDVPLERLVEELGAGGDLSRNPLFQVMLVLHPPTEDAAWPGLQVALEPVPCGAEFDLHLSILPTQAGLSCALTYHADLFVSETADSLLQHWEAVLREFVRDPGQRVSSAARLVRPSILQINVLASFTADPLAEVLSVWLAELGSLSRVHLAPHGQVFQSLLDPASEVQRNQQGANVLLLRLSDWLRNGGTADLERSLDELVAAISSTAQRSPVPHLVVLCPLPPSVQQQPALCAQLERVQAKLAAALSLVRGVSLLQPQDIAAQYPIADIHDEYADQVGQVPYSSAYFVALGTSVVRRLAALLLPPYKVIVTDCDQTLWSGIVGEVGPEGIELDAPHRYLQAFLVEQQAAGMLLCLCSKNNETDLAEVFESRPDMPLRREHILAQRVNWRAKSENLISLARELQLGLQSFIFLDDSAIECAEVRARCPQVLTLQLPAEAGQIPALLRRVWAFDHAASSPEDRQRTLLYRQNQQREQVRTQVRSLGEFVASLELVVTLRAIQEEDIARVSQLTQRTNQLNCSAIRRTEEELRQLLRTAQLEGQAVHVQDRFGDYGLVGCMLYSAQPGALCLDTFLLSCRALGRGVEVQMLAWLGNLARQRGLDTLQIRYRRTSKNQPAREFLKRMGVALGEEVDGGGLLQLSAQAGAALDPLQDLACSEATEALPAAPTEDRRATQGILTVPEWAWTASDLIADLLAKIRALRPRRVSRRGGFVAPRTPLQELVAAVWGEVLGLDSVGITDSFFDLGGHSLLATQVVSRLRAACGVDVPLRALFDAPTVEELTARIEALRHVDPGRRPTSMVPVPRDRELPLSFAQQRLWFLDRLQPGTALYSGAAAVRLVGEVDVRALERAIEELVSRHESLRTRFPERQGSARQEILPPAPVPLPRRELLEAELRPWLAGELVRPFDLEQGPLFRAALARLPTGEHVLMLTMHHIIADGWSGGVLVRELTELYRAFSHGLRSPLPPLPLQYADYAQWQREWLQGEVLAAQLAYWRGQLRDAPVGLELPTDYPRPSILSYRGAARTCELSATLSRQLVELSRAQGVTLFMTLLAAFTTLLYRYSGQEDILVGTPIAGRTQAATEGLIGLFANTLALRVRLSRELTLRELLQQIRSVTLEAYAQQDLPFEKLVEALAPARDLSRSPLYQVMLVLQNTPTPELALDGLSIRRIEVESATAKCDLTLYVTPTGEGLRVTLEYSTDLFHSATVERMLGHLQTLLSGMVTQPEQRASALPLLTGAERRQLLSDWNATQAAVPSDLGLHELVSQQAARSPEDCAVIVGNQQLSYRQLDERSSRLASLLRGCGVQREVLVGLCLDRSLDMLVAMLAILKAGGAYVPLDPQYPNERIDFILKDTQAALLLTQQSLRDRFSSSAVRLLCLDALPSASQFPSEPLPDAHPGSQQAAYVIYTSGSTGQPKGVIIEHRSVVAFCSWAGRAFTAAELARVLASTSICFDLSVFELFVPLCFGGCVVLVENALALPTLPAATGVTLINTVPSVLTALLQATELPASVRTVNLAGEPLPQALVDRIYQHGAVQRVLNLYGPSECTTYSTVAEVARGTVPTIGRPIDNTQTYVLDPDLQPLPIGIIGELYIGGAGVARGYLRRPALSAERFIPDPFSEATGGRLYKTGDRCRWLADGQLQFLGRADHQVKLHGFRIELGEIEAVLDQHPGLRGAAVVVRGDSDLDKRLVAYVVPRGAEAASPSELRSYLQSQLPTYMIPAHFVELPSLPLSANGKVDRRALAALELSAAAEPVGQVAPRSALEELLAEIWRDVLHIEALGVHDNFFSLGGDSILAIQVIGRVQQAGFAVSVRQIFECQTIAELAPVLSRQSRPAAAQGAVLGPVTLTPIQRWFFAQRLPDPHHFNQAVWLEARGPLDVAALRAAVRQLVQHHDALRMRFHCAGKDVQQSCAASDESVTVSVHDLLALAPGAQRQAEQELAAAAQASLSLGQGPLMRVLWFEYGRGQPGRLLLIIHHLVVDGVSWRVLLEDLQTAYAQACRREPIRLPAKTTSFQCWAEQLAAHARSEAVLQQAAYWQALPGGRPLPRDLLAAHDRENTVNSARDVEVMLDVEETRALLQQVPAVYRTEINDLLLTALLQTYVEWTGQHSLRFDLEGHGREELSRDLDVSRTVGWFTTLFPVVLELPPGSLGDVIKGIKEQLRQIPDHGLGYGLLRYLSSSRAAGEDWPAGEAAEIRFNYLGQFDGSEAVSALFRWTRESTGTVQSPAALRTHVLDISGFVSGQQLHFVWTYSEKLHARTTIESLAQGFMAALRRLIGHCLSAGAGGRTPADFPWARLSQGRLDQLVGTGSGVEDLYPLSPLQQGILFHTLRDEGKGSYLQQLLFRVSAGLQIPAFVAAWQQLLRRHAVLRSAFVWEGQDEPLQIVAATAELPWQQVDLRAHSASEQEQQLATFLQHDRQRGFELSHAPLLRLAIFRVDAQSYQVVWTFHHLLLDGWSLPVVFADLLAFYEAAQLGTVARLPCPTPYREYIRWLRQQDRTQAESFWRATLQGLACRPSLSVFGRSTSESAAQHAECEERLPPVRIEEITQLARAYGVTTSTVLQGAWAILLARYTQETDVVFGATLSGRSAGLAGIDQMVGLFINTLPVRVQVDPAAEVAAWLRALQTQQAAQLPHAHASLRDIQAWSELPRGQALFEALLVVENYPIDAALRRPQRLLQITDLHAREQNNYPLTLTIQLGHEPTLRLSYDAGRFSADSMRRMLGHYQMLLQGMTATPQGRLSALGLLTPAEQRQLVVEWNATQAEYPQDHCLHSLFEEQVERSADAVALECADQRLTYRELDRRANQLAHFLRSQGVGPDVLVGLCAERSAELVVGLLGILKAGGAYLPLDPSLPTERLRFLCQHSRVALILTQDRLRSRLSAGPGRVLCLDSDWPMFRSERTDSPASGVGPDHLAYVIYTSGSTGQPKGVLIPHRGVVNYLCYCQKAYGLARAAGAPVHTSIGVDLTVTSLWAPLVSGGSVILVAEPSEEHGLLKVLQAQRELSLVKLTPAHLGLLQELVPATALSHVRAFVVGGEALSFEQLRPIREHAPAARLFNEYGPTETVVGCCVYEAVADEPGQGPVPIGRPIANTQLYVLDASLQPLPVGVVGELFIGGLGVARGYLHRPELTAERFIPSPFARDGHARLYRTGDLCRFRPDGNLEFVGRRDQQVKLRGYRVELGEIESALKEHPAIREAAAVVREDRAGSQRLLAYLQLHAGDRPEPEALQSYLRSRLPDYMVPSLFEIMGSLPLSASGKVDRLALPPPEPIPAEVPAVAEVAATPEEARLAELWAQVLRLPHVGRRQSFFELGGDSILAMQLISRARQAGLAISLRQLYRHPNIAALAEVAKPTESSPPAAQPTDGPVELTPIQRWFFALRLPEPNHFNQAILLQTREPLQLSVLQQAVETLVEQHEALRLRFRSTPSTVEQHIAAHAPAIPVQMFDLSGSDPGEQPRALASIFAAAQASLNLEHGPLLKVVWIDLGPQHSGRLLFVIHHLAVDGVSFRVLLEDLEIAYRQARRAEPVRLPPQTASFAQGAAWLTHYARSAELQRELAYWQALRPAKALPVDHIAGENTVLSARSVATALTVGETRQLLQGLPAQHGTEITDALLTAQLTALAAYTGSRRLQLDLEHHGRPELAEELDLSRTVGWFTAVFPAVFELPDASLVATLMAVKEQRQQIPSHGLGYGLLRYLCPDAPLLQAEIAQTPSDVSFNYLGQLDASLAGSALFAVAHEAVGPTQSPQARRTHRLEVNAWILQERLHVQWSYSENLHQFSTIAAMAQRFTDVLRALLDGASAGGRAVAEPASATRGGGVDQRESEPKL